MFTTCVGEIQWRQYARQVSC